MQGIYIIIGILIILIIWAFIEQKLIMTSKYIIKSLRLPKQFNHTKFLVLADLHNRTFGKNNQRLAKRIEKLNPDFILVAGDMINRKETCYPSNGSILLESISKKYKIYYAYGNHEQRIELYNEEPNAECKGETTEKTLISEQVSVERKYIYSTWVEFKKRLSELNVTFLNNDQICITSNGTKLCITGISIGQKYFRRNNIPEMESDYIENIIGKSNDEQFQILIAHNPIFFRSYSDWGADLVISGHLHGGMVRLPGIGGIISPQAKFFPKYHSGKYSENGHSMVVSRGLGSHSIMPRLFNIPELVYVELDNE